MTGKDGETTTYQAKNVVIATGSKPIEIPVAPYDRNLIVSSKEEAKKKNIPIRTGNDPHEIPDNAEMVMQIIPLRRIDATQASRDLATLLPGTSTVTANQDSNSLLALLSDAEYQAGLRRIRAALDCADAEGRVIEFTAELPFVMMVWSFDLPSTQNR